MAVLLINGGEPSSVARPYYQRKMVTVTIALDEDDRVGHAYGVRAIPTVLFLDEKGIIRKIYIGTMSEAMVNEGLAAAGAK